MDHDKNWGQDAPQDQDKRNVREVYPKPVPHYDHYQMHRNTAEPEQKPPQKKNKRKNTAGKKIAGTIALAVIFGVTASAVFQASNFAAQKYLGTEKNIETTPPISQTELTVSETSSYSSGSNAGSAGSVAEVAAAAMPSVVAITSVSIQEIPSFFGMYTFGSYGTQQFSSESSGSGIIVGENDDELLIATNNHVVENATTLSVCFIGDEVVDAEEELQNVNHDDINVEDAVSAKIKGTDAPNDLAVVAVQKSDIPEDTLSEIKIAQIGDSDGLQVGEQVVAIGNALGYGQSVTSGWVSALDRSIAAEDVTTSGLIQTDAAINPGNSGGALLNMQGELIGINSAKYADNAVEGMGYAIPISKAQPILEELMNRKTRDKVEESKAAYLGITPADLTATAIQMYNMPAGVFITDVARDGAAERAGICTGDIIVKLDGQKVSGTEDLADQLQYYTAGETVDIVISRADSGEYKEQTVQVILDSRPS